MSDTGTDRPPNIVYVFYDNFGWGELGCYGGGILRGAETPRIDGLAAEGTRLLNFNVEAMCTPSRSALLTGRHPIRSGTANVPITGGPDGLTRWEITTAQALSDAGYATAMYGKWHLGADPEMRAPTHFGFDESVWIPRSSDESMWTAQSYFPERPATARPYTDAEIALEHPPVYAAKKGEAATVAATYDLAYRAAFDRKITEWAIDFMRRSHAGGKPFYLYLPYSQVHVPPIPDPEFAGSTKRGNWADLLTQMDAFTGMLLDALDELGLVDDTIFVWNSDNGPEDTYRYPAADPDPFGGQWQGASGPWRGHYVTTLEGSLRTPCIVRWPGKVPAGRVSNEIVHELDMFPTLVRLGGGLVPEDRMIDGIDVSEFLLGRSEESGRDVVLCFNGMRLQAVKWRQWKAEITDQDDMYGTWAPLSTPSLYNLEWDLREEHQVGFTHAWVLQPMAAAVGAFLASLAVEPPIKVGTPDPYAPPATTDLQVREHIQLGAMTQFVTTVHDVRRSQGLRSR